MLNATRTMLGLLLLCSCGDEERSPGRFGEITSAVVIVNPVINEGSTSGVIVGIDRAGVPMEVAEVGEARTDATGLALLEGLPTGEMSIAFDSGEVGLSVVEERELYDVVVAVRDDGATHVFPPVRYPISDNVIELSDGGDLAAAAANDDAIILLGPGTYAGNFEIRAEGVLILGAWSIIDGPLSAIEGNLDVLGGSGRLRGVRVNGTLSSPANNFSAAFCDVAGANISGNGVTLLRNVFVEGRATVPSSSAVLVDNEGIP
jgi:hypothetical protein